MCRQILIRIRIHIAIYSGKYWFPARTSIEVKILNRIRTEPREDPKHRPKVELKVLTNHSN